MRGKAKVKECLLAWVRITPAHAGKSTAKAALDEALKDHPRTCGEKTNMPELKGMSVGSPPHMRGKESS